MIIHIPHASTFIPPEYRDAFDSEKLTHELAVMTDWYTDELFSSDAPRVVFPVSRLVCDPERFRADAEEVMSTIGMGAVYTNCSDGTPLRTESPQKCRLQGDPTWLECGRIQSIKQP